MTLEELVNGVEELMGQEVAHQDLHALSAQLMRACNALQYQGKIMGLAVYQFDLAKGKAVDNLRNEDLKLDLMRAKLAGILAKESAVYERAERVTRALPIYIDGLRSIISQLKQELKYIP